MQPVLDLFTAAEAAYKAGGSTLMLGVLLFGLVKLLRMPTTQRALMALSPRLAWANWPMGVRMLFIFALSTAGKVCEAVAAGRTVPSALPEAVVAGLVAMGVDGAVSAAARS
jgi:hypothetical protein